MEKLEQIRAKMESGGQSEPAILSFLNNAGRFLSGGSGLISESGIDRLEALPKLEELPLPGEAGGLFGQTVVIKLNGGLGTSMGLDRAKSLLEVKDGLTFLDIIARQILHLRSSNPGLRFLLMNSYSTSGDTQRFLRKYPDLGAPQELEFVQSKAPKLDADSCLPVEWPAQPELEWCPPGHGDLYASLEGSGRLDALLAKGVKYAFVSNSDNLGATPSLRILNYFASRGASFLMEVTRRTQADSKGGHLAVRKSDRRLLLRESAQCPEEDQDAFQDVARHSFFNTNNLWIRLDRLKELLSEEGGMIPLPLITNRKRVDPRNPDSPPVVQLETAMGAAIELFGDACALEVDRSRFAPVKKTSDLFVLRSDACEIRDDWTLGLVPERQGNPPQVELNDSYKLIADFERLVTVPPSLLECRSLAVHGAVAFRGRATMAGDVVLHSSGDGAVLPEGRYCDENVTVSPPTSS